MAQPYTSIDSLNQSDVNVSPTRNTRGARERGNPRRGRAATRRPVGPSAGIPVDAKTKGAFQSLWKNQRRIKGGPLGKYQAALDVVGKRRYDETRPPFKSAQLVFDLRNHFVHFKPKTQGHRRRARLREGAQESQSR